MLKQLKLGVALEPDLLLDYSGRLQTEKQDYLQMMDSQLAVLEPKQNQT